MHRRTITIVVVVAILAITGLAVGLTQTWAKGESDLATLTPAQLLADVTQHAANVDSVSGSIAWKNDVLGLSALSFGGQGTGDLASLLTGGSGRLWAQGGKVRFEIQGAMGDTTVVGDQTSVWVYVSSSNTATEYVLPTGVVEKLGNAAGGEQTSGASTTTSAEAQVDPITRMNDFVQKLAPTAAMAVSGQEKVAGRTCYLLSLVPEASNTVVGSVQVAVDGETYLPLRIEIYAKGEMQPVLSAGFTSISYSKIADDTLTFTPPANATVDHKTLSLPAGLTGVSGDTGDETTPSTAPSSAASTASEQAPLTLAEAAAKVGFTPLAPQTTGAGLDFSGAFVIPAKQVDLQSVLSGLGSGLGMLGGGETDQPAGASSTTSSTTAAPASPSVTLPSGPVTLGPTLVLHYGQGFGSVVLVEAQLPANLLTQLEQTLANVPLVSRTTVAGGDVYQLNTSLGSVMLWDKDGLLLVAAGSVSQADLMGFSSSVR